MKTFFYLLILNTLSIMLHLKDTNLALKGGEVLINFTTLPNGFGERILVICNQFNGTKILKQYKKHGFNYSNAVFFDGFNFFRLTATLKQYTIKGIQVIISNELYHINKHIEKGNRITLEIK